VGILATLVWSPSADAATYRVPSEYATIHAAMALAGPGDTVLVAPGTYTDFEVRQPFGIVAALAFVEPGAALVSEGGPGVTLLDISGGASLAPNVNGMRVDNASGVGTTRVSGFTVDGASETGGRGMVARFSEDVEITNCIFRLSNPTGQTVEFRGGVEYRESSGRILDCVFEDCEAPTGAGVFQTGGTLEIEGSTFRRCMNEAVKVQSTVTTTVRSCHFERNVSLERGGAVEAIFPGLIEDCTFVENSGTVWGGAVNGARVTIRRCLFDGNTVSGTGAAIFASNFGNVIENNTIVRSHNDVSTLGGAAVVIQNSNSTTFRNNIIAHSSGSPAVRSTNSTVTASCNVFFGNEDGDAVGYTLRPTDRVVDPEFCDPEEGDWTVHGTSPCLPANSLGCGLIGVFGEGCGVITTEPWSWGRIKEAHRGRSGS
jgi:hypothetical protein